jgi:hypothetical protein
MSANCKRSFAIKKNRVNCRLDESAIFAPLQSLRAIFPGIGEDGSPEAGRKKSEMMAARKLK